MLDLHQIDHYWTQGWLVVNDIFPAAEAEAIAQLAWEMSEQELIDNPTSTAARDHDDTGAPLPRKIDTPFRKHERFRAMALDPRLVRVIGEILGTTPLLARDQLFMKPPRFGSAKPYHQDNYYFKCSPPDGVITAWIALDDVDEENGCLRYIDGSHREGILPHTRVAGEPHNLAIANDLIDFSRESLAIVRKGGVVFHHGETLHTSHRNGSDRWRRAYATHWLTAEVTSELDTVTTAYFHEIKAPGE